jgi:tRNA-specific 2-thiouridylase
LVVGSDPELFESELACRLTWIDRDVVDGGGVAAQIRSRSAAAPVERIDVSDGASEARVVFAQPQRAIAPGQTVAFYVGEVVVGSGVIETAGPS